MADILKDVEGAEELGLYSDVENEREALRHAFKLMIEKLLPDIKAESQLTQKAERFEQALGELKELLDIET
jgi:hypothetical protein